jgi:hypothetical protein
MSVESPLTVPLPGLGELASLAQILQGDLPPAGYGS